MHNLESDIPIFLGSIPITNLSKEKITQTILFCARNKCLLRVHLCNAFTLVSAERDLDLKYILQQSHMNIPDGKGVFFALRKKGLRSNFRGMDLLDSVFSTSGTSRLTHFMFGGIHGDEFAFISRLQNSNHKVIVKVPPFVSDIQQLDIISLVSEINNSKANIVWLGIGTPKQDKLVAQLSNHLKIPIIPVGAVFDFLGGRQREAPKIFQKAGLEWLYRFLKEPRRLWKRYILGNLAFIRIIYKNRGFQ